MKNYEIVKLDINCAGAKIPYLRFHCFSLKKSSCAEISASFLRCFFFRDKSWKFFSCHSLCALCSHSNGNALKAIKTLRERRTTSGRWGWRKKLFPSPRTQLSSCALKWIILQQHCSSFCRSLNSHPIPEDEEKPSTQTFQSFISEHIFVLHNDGASWHVTQNLHSIHYGSGLNFTKFNLRHGGVKQAHPPQQELFRAALIFSLGSLFRDSLVIQPVTLRKIKHKVEISKQ